MRSNQCAEDEEHHEEPADRTDADDVPVSDGGHGDQREVDTLPVGRRTVTITLQVWKRVLHLQATWFRKTQVFFKKKPNSLGFLLVLLGFGLYWVFRIFM